MAGGEEKAESKQFYELSTGVSIGSGVSLMINFSVRSRHQDKRVLAIKILE
jgi:hypothetical protein